MEKNVTKSGEACSRQGKKKMNEKAVLRAAFESATYPEQVARAVKNMGASGLFEEEGLGFETWKLAQFSERGKNLVKMISFGGLGSSSSQRKDFKLRQAFYSAKSADEMIKAFQKMESHFKKKDLGYDCWRLTQKLYEEHHGPEKILCYGKRALDYSVERNNLCNNHDMASLMMITNILPMLGCACLKLKRFDESLIYLNWSRRNLSKLERDSSFPAELLFSSLFATLFRLAIVTTVFGRGEEAVVHMRNIMETHQKAKTEGSINLAIDKLVEELKRLGVSEDDKVNGGIRLLKEMKENASAKDSPEKNSNV